LVGEGIVIYRAVKDQKSPPGPGQLLFSSGVFVLLALLAESEKARPLAVTLAWGFDIAAFMNLYGASGLKSSGASWPPPKAADTIIIPDGSSTTTEAPSKSNPKSYNIPFPPHNYNVPSPSGSKTV